MEFKTSTYPNKIIWIDNTHWRGSYGDDEGIIKSCFVVAEFIPHFTDVYINRLTFFLNCLKECSNVQSQYAVTFITNIHTLIAAELI